MRESLFLLLIDRKQRYARAVRYYQEWEPSFLAGKRVAVVKGFHAFGRQDRKATHPNAISPTQLSPETTKARAPSHRSDPQSQLPACGKSGNLVWPYFFLQNRQRISHIHGPQRSQAHEPQRTGSRDHCCSHCRVGKALAAIVHYHQNVTRHTSMSPVPNAAARDPGTTQCHAPLECLRQRSA